LAALATEQDAVLAGTQLRELGFSRDQVAARVSNRRLYRVHQGVYSIVHPSKLSAHGRWRAAVYACGPGAVLSHRSAAALLGIRRTDRAATDVTTPRRTGRSRRGINVHRPGRLTDADITVVRGIPCTTVARTLVDLAGVTDRRSVERACDQAERLELFDLRAIEEQLERAGPRRGAKRLRAVIAAYKAGQRPSITESELEERFLAIVVRAGLPRPLVNEWILLPDGTLVRVDFLWPAERLAVETDGRDTHARQRAFVSDRDRDQRLTIAGWRPVRFTWEQVVHAPTTVERRLEELVRAGVT
jgi:hypothetical protein